MRRGFTLIELMIVVGVIVVLSLSAVVLYNGNKDQNILNDQAQIITQQLNNASVASSSQDGGYQWWMRFDNPAGNDKDTTQLCYGNSYTASSTSCATEGVGAAESQRYVLNDSIQFIDPASGTSKDIVFGKATGLPTATVSVVIALVNGSGSRVITVNANGRIDNQVGAVPPTVISPTAADITYTTVTLGANVTSIGGAAITARGTCWGITAAPTTNCAAEGGTTTGIFIHARTGLPSSTLIYYRGYATNSGGTAYSADGSFNTAYIVGPNSPGTMANDATIGNVNWQSPERAMLSDYAYSTYGWQDGLPSVYLKATNFGFSIPAGATINGIMVEIQKLASGTFARDNAVKIVKSNGIFGITNKADLITDYPTSGFAYTAYGSPSDLWGETWTPADINSVNFGVGFSSNDNNATNVWVDHIRITVYYTN